MKKLTQILLLLMVAFTSTAIAQPMARVQVIHNSADLAAATVDVWLNDALLLDDFSFRNASPFVDAPAGVSLDISIQPSSSTDTVGALFRKSLTLTDGETYVVVANGIISATGYAPAQPFDLYAFAGAQEAGTGGMMNTDVLVFHGATDAPTVNVKEVGVGVGDLITDLSYEDFDGYATLPTADYALQVRTTDETTVAEYSAPLSTLALGGNAAVVLASGFLDPSANSSGPAFGLWVALPTGGALVELPSAPISTARLQVIHNSADLAAATVDVWLDDVLLLDDFNFRDASPFIDAPASTDFDVSIQPSSSTDTVGALFKKTFNLMGAEKYIVVANGIISGSGYMPMQPFDLYAIAAARESSALPAYTDLLAFHGATDAPMVDIVEVGVGAGNIIDDLEYPNSFGYLELPTADYSLQVRTQDQTTVAQYSAPLSTLALDGAAGVVVASGFLDPSMNSAGPAFGLYVALPGGGPMTMLPTETISTARLQIIHNCADLAAATVDVWLDDVLLLDDVSFRQASAYMDAPAGTNFVVSIQPSSSTDTVGALFQKTFNLPGGEKFQVIASGIISASGYSPVQPFDLIANAGVRESAETPGNVSVLAFHGATDAPTVDIVETAVPAGTIVDNISYGDLQGYLDLSPLDYTLDVRDATGATTVATYQAPLLTLGLGDEAITVLASGFLDPSSNSNGPAFGLWVALSAGGPLVELPLITGIEENADVENLTFYPNPAQGNLNLDLEFLQATQVKVDIFNLSGQLVKSENLGTQSGNASFSFDIANLNAGMYQMRVATDRGVVTGKFIKM